MQIGCPSELQSGSALLPQGAHLPRASETRQALTILTSVSCLGISILGEMGFLLGEMGFLLSRDSFP